MSGGRWGGIAAELLDLVLPARCAGCGSRAPGEPLCRSCRVPFGGAPRLSWPEPVPAGLAPPWSVAPYAGTVREALLAYKEGGRVALARPLGAALAASLAAAAAGCRLDDGPMLVVPVPGSAASRRARGHDPLGRLARVAVRRCRVTGCAVRLLPALRLARRVADQSGLGARERARNVHDAHVVGRSARRLVEGRMIVLLDDIVTTGATLAEAARALRAAGAVVMSAATIAAAARGGGRP